MTSVIIDKRYCGPPNSGNGGYVCGRLAHDIAGGAEVTLRAPIPLDRPLDVVATDDNMWELRDGAMCIATGRPADVALTRLQTASFDEARAVELMMAIKPHEHPLPHCFVCGPARAPGDGLRIAAGPRPHRSHNGLVVLAGTWVPDSSVAAEDGLVAPEFLWAALDCPTGYATAHDQATGRFDRTPILLGRMAASVVARPRAGEHCVVTAWANGRDGRKRFAEAALHGEKGRLLAIGRATWIAVEREVSLGA